MDDTTGLSTVQLLQVLEVSRLLAAAADLEGLLHKIARACCGLLHCERASIWIHDPGSDELYTTVFLHSDAGPIRIPAASGVVGAAFNSNTIVNVPHAYNDDRFNPTSDRATGFVTRSLLAVPMLNIEGRPIGVIEAVNKLDADYSVRDQELLQLLADQAGVAIQRKQLQEVAVQAAQIQREIELARQVQQSLLPKTLPVSPRFDIARWARSASTTGGDCYDIWSLPDGRIGVFLADASGHGLAPALVVSQVRTVIRALCEGPVPARHPHEVLARVNRRLTADMARYRFVTAFLGFLDADGVMEWQSAGQGPILFRASADSSVQQLNPPVPPLNALEELPEDPPPPPLRLQPGGSLALISDGIFEAFNPAGVLFTGARVLASLEHSRTAPAIKSVESLVAAVEQWEENGQAADDQTIVIINAVA